MIDINKIIEQNKKLVFHRYGQYYQGGLQYFQELVMKHIPVDKHELFIKQCDFNGFFININQVQNYIQLFQNTLHFLHSDVEAVHLLTKDFFNSRRDRFKHENE